MASREALLAVTESAYGTTTSTPTLGTDKWYFNLPDSDSFQAEMQPVMQEIAYGGGIAIPFDVRADHYQTQVAWKGLVYPSLDNFLLNLAAQRIPTGQASPWTTTEPVGDLASATLYHYWQHRGSATPVRKKYLGCKLQSLSLDCSRQDPKLKFSASLVAQKEQGNAIETGPPADPDSTEFPAPTDAQLPLGPYLFSHSSTNFSVGGAAVTKYQSLSIKITNALDVLYFENKFPSDVAFCGRTIEVTFQHLLLGTPTYRTFYQGLTDKATSVKFDNGTNSFKIDLLDQCHFTAYSRQLGLGKEFLETITIKARLDISSGTDCTLTFT
jgi:hypothetical protein